MTPKRGGLGFCCLPGEVKLAHAEGKADCTDCKVVMGKILRGLSKPAAKVQKQQWRDACKTAEKATAWIDGPLATHLSLRAASATGRAPPTQVTRIKTEEADEWAGEEYGKLFCTQQAYKTMFELEPTVDEIAFHRLPTVGMREGVMVDPADLPPKWQSGRRFPSGVIQLKRTLKESVMKETELANTMTSMVAEEVDNVWGAVQNLPQEAMASSHVTTRKSEKGDHMQAVMTVAQREAKEKEQK